MKNVIVLGAGLVGSVIAKDLLKNFNVTSVDLDPDTLDKLKRENGIHTVLSDLSKEKNVKNVIKDADFVVSAVPGFMGYSTLKYIIESGKNVVDIAFFPEDCFELDGLAKKHNVTAIVDCGVAPGMSNIICGYYNKIMKVDSFKCLVGGLPFEREWPYEYKAVFSPIDAIEEYVRPARYIQNGQLVVRPALSDPEHEYFEGIGTLESWNSDGLRSLAVTMKIPDMIEKTLRYPGTIEYLKVLRETGLFSFDEIEVKGVKIRPVDVTAKLLFPKWKLKEGQEDFTVLRVEIVSQGTKYRYDLFDRYDKTTRATSMSRTTGYTCSATVNLLAEGKFTRKGICPPEYIGEDETCFSYIINYLEGRNVIYKLTSGVV